MMRWLANLWNALFGRKRTPVPPPPPPPPAPAPAATLQLEDSTDLLTQSDTPLDLEN